MEITAGYARSNSQAIGKTRTSVSEIVCWVFREFASGVSPWAIARRFNAGNIPCPSGNFSGPIPP